MPFCRKCGRRLPEYSESCPDCGSSTTAPLIHIKKTRSNSKFKAAAPTKIAKAVIPASEVTVSTKVIKPAEPAKTPVLSKKPTPIKPTAPPKPQTRIKDLVKHEIKQSDISLEEDIITNPHDYETQTFDFDLQCPNDHFFAAGSTLPESKGKAYCPICGEQLRRKQRRNHRYKIRF